MREWQQRHLILSCPGQLKKHKISLAGIQQKRALKSILDLYLIRYILLTTSTKNVLWWSQSYNSFKSLLNYRRLDRLFDKGQHMLIHGMGKMITELMICHIFTNQIDKLFIIEGNFECCMGRCGRENVSLWWR